MRSTSNRSAAKLYADAQLPHRKTMLAMRKIILELVPEAEEVVSYGMPAFRYKGKVVAGLMAAKNHVGYYPFSGSVLSLFDEELKKYSKTKSALHVPVDSPLSKAIIKKLLNARISQCGLKNGQSSSAKYQGKDEYWKSIGLAAPARRGLIDNNFYKLGDLKRVTEEEFKTVHAIGPSALKLIKGEMKTKRIKFRS